MQGTEIELQKESSLDGLLFNG